MKKLLGTLALLALLAAPRIASATIAGTPSTGTYLVGSGYANLASAQASGTITIVSSRAALGTWVQVGPSVFQVESPYATGLTTYTIANNLATAINAAMAASPTLIPLLQVKASVANHANVVALTAAQAGALQNTISLYSSSPTAVQISGAYLTGGRDNAQACIDYVCLQQGRDWFINDSAAGSALSLVIAINSSPALKQVVNAVPLGANVYLRSVGVALPYVLGSTDVTDLAPFAAAMYGGASGQIDAFKCDLGQVASLPTANYPEGCRAYQLSDHTAYVSTETVVGVGSWLAR